MTEYVTVTANKTFMVKQHKGGKQKVWQVQKMPRIVYL